MEVFLTKQIENGIRGVKLGTKTPQDVAKRTNKFLERLKPMNPGMYDELHTKWIHQCKKHSSSKEETY